jgi:hypothetical protein
LASTVALEEECLIGLPGYKQELRGGFGCAVQTCKFLWKNSENPSLVLPLRPVKVSDPIQSQRPGIDEDLADVAPAPVTRINDLHAGRSVLNRACDVSFGAF